MPFLERRIEEHQAKNLHLDRSLLDAEEEMAHRHTCAQDASERLLLAKSARAGRSRQDEQETRCRELVAFVSEKFDLLQEELEEIYGMSLGQNDDSLLERMQGFIKYISELKDSLRA